MDGHDDYLTLLLATEANHGGAHARDGRLPVGQPARIDGSGLTVDLADGRTHRIAGT